VCGDGDVGPGEACDDGPDNGPGQRATRCAGQRVRRRRRRAGRGVRRRGRQRRHELVQGRTVPTRVRRRAGRAGRGLRRRQPERQRRVHERVRAGDLRRREGRADRGVRRRQHADDTTRAPTRAPTRPAATGSCSRATWRSATTGSTTRTTRRARTRADNVCGDGKVFNTGGGAEECDDGVDNGPGKACNAMCVLNVCGDGDKGPDEECDDGNNERRRRVLGDLQARGVRQRVARPGRGVRRRGQRRQGRRLHRRVQPAGCGDGFEQPSLGEQCDLGGQNSDGGACTSMCKDATCGDGLIQANVEQCDDGANNGPGKACRDVQAERVRRRRQGAGRGVRRRQPEQRRRVHERVQAGDLRRRVQAAGRAVRPRG
jgi:hypothetical protein